MISKEFAFNSLILLSVISFGVFGSLSHLFNLAIIILLVLSLWSSRKNFQTKPHSSLLFLALCSIFFIFFIRSFFHYDTWESLASLNPMLPIPVIGLMILLTNNQTLRVSPSNLALIAKTSIIVSYLVYFLLLSGLGDHYGLQSHFRFRLELFTGNPVPFSTVLFGITIFCLSNWRYERYLLRFFTIIIIFLGFYLACILSGTRGTLLALMLSTPIVLAFVLRSFLFSLLIIIFLILIGYIFQTYGILVIDNGYFNRISGGIETLVNNKSLDNSIMLKVDMWKASLKAIREVPLFGYDVSNRFAAIKPYLTEVFEKKFTHSHNDVLGSITSVGLIGGPLSIISLLTPTLAALLSNSHKRTKLFIGITITISVFCTAGVNTVFFNDVTSAWLAFASFLIWNMKFSKTAY